MDSLRLVGERYARCTLCAELGIPADDRRTRFWQLAESARPDPVRVLFIAESAPQRNKRGRLSYFYLPEDDPMNQDRSVLFWALSEALSLAKGFGVSHPDATTDPKRRKLALLEEFRQRGFWLLDSAKCAVNGVSPGIRDRAIRRCAETWLREELRVLDPERVLLIKANVHRVILPLLDQWGFGQRVANREVVVPHPGSGQLGNFRKAMRLLSANEPGLLAPTAMMGK